MPLLGNKLFTFAEAPVTIKPEETIYTIEETGEQFKSKEAYESRKAQYEEPVWTCQCTARPHLTYKDALHSEKEQRELLARKFPEYFEHPVLSLVHHNTDDLDKLVDQAWLRLQIVFVIGESVTLRVKAAGRTLHATIVRVDTGGAELYNPAGCPSPNSDKENAEARESANAKVLSPKLLPYHYTVKLPSENKLVSQIPAEDLVRSERTPTKDLVQLFIRANSLRASPLAPWVVCSAMVEKHKLAAKFADIFTARGGGKAPAVASRKRKSAPNAGENSQQNKKARLSQGKADSASATGGGRKARSVTKTDVSSASKPSQTGDSAKKVDVSHRPETPKKGESTSKTPEKCDLKSNPPKKPDPKSNTSKKSDIKSDSPKKLDSKSGTPKKSDIKSNTPKKSDIKSKSPKKTDTKSTSPKKSDSKSNTPKKNGPQKTPEAGKKLVTLKQTGSKTKKKPSSEASQTSKKKANTPSSSLKKAATPANVRARPTSAGADGMAEDSKLPMNIFDIMADKGSPIANPSVRDQASRIGTETAEANKKSPKKKQTMKQATLFDLKPSKNKIVDNGAKSSPAKKAAKSPLKQPPLAVKLVKATRAGDTELTKRLLTRCAKELSEQQRANLVDDVRAAVTEKWEFLEERKKLLAMTPEQREEYQRKKREARNAQRRDQLRDASKKYEDTSLKLAPLPTPHLVATPDGLPNELFGDVAMIAQFLACYQGLLMPNDNKDKDKDKGAVEISAEQLMKALVGGEAGFQYLSDILSVLLQTLLQDEIAEAYEELSCPLSGVAVTRFTASEMVRLCLRKRDDALTDDGAEAASVDSESVDEEDDVVPEPLVEALETAEFYSLAAEDKLQILVGLCTRIMGSYSIQDYMEEKQKELTELYKKRLTHLKKNKEVTQSKKDTKKEGKSEVDKADGATGDKPITEFHEKCESPAPEESLLGAMRHRRQNAAILQAEKEERERVKREQREREFEESKRQQELEHVERQFEAVTALSRGASRHEPLGTDRNHTRYWLLHNCAPGLYMEKGWAPKDISYSVNPSQDEAISEVEGETTVPHQGQNLWFVYSTLAELTSLKASLSEQGIRESALLTQLNKALPDLEKQIAAASQEAEKPAEEEDEEEVGMVAGFREELSEMEMRMRCGGLGGVVDFEAWEGSLETGTSIAEFGPLLIATQQHIHEKFLKGIFLPDKVKKKAVKEEEAQTGDAEEEEAFDLVYKGLERWRAAILACPTLSRLHVLMAVLHSCVKWEKSAEDAKCKICRRMGDGGGDDTDMLLCDECNQAFHMYCLRPAVHEVPEGEWKCPGCAPATRRRTRDAKVDYRGMQAKPAESSGSSDAEDDDDDEEIVHDETCAVCTGDEQLIYCSACPAAFHLDCHTPPLRRPPRSCWKCQQCTTGVKIRKAKPRASAKKRPKKYGSYSDSDEEEEEEKPARNNPRRKPAKKKVSESESDNPRRKPAKKKVSESESDDLTDSSSGQKKRNARKKKTANKSGGRRTSGRMRKPTQKAVENEEDEDSESEEEQRPSRSRAAAKKRQLQYESSTEEAEEEVTPSRRRRAINKKRPRRQGVFDEEDSADEQPKKVLPKRERRTPKKFDSYTDDSDLEKTPDEGDDEPRRKTRRVKKEEPQQKEKEEEDESDEETEVEEEEDQDTEVEGEDEGEEAAEEEGEEAAEEEESEDEQVILDREYKQMDVILQRLCRHQKSWPFYDPVSLEDAPDYFDLITTPMCLTAIKDKVAARRYESARGFLNDLALMLDNAEKYNEESSSVGRCVAPFEKSIKSLHGQYLAHYPYRRVEKWTFSGPGLAEQPPGGQAEQPPGEQAEQPPGGQAQPAEQQPPPHDIMNEHSYTSPSKKS